jgi:hypothetical protein
VSTCFELRILHISTDLPLRKGVLTLHELELPGPAGRHADISRMAIFDNIVERLHGLFNLDIRNISEQGEVTYRGIVVESMALDVIHYVSRLRSTTYLEDIDVIRLQSLAAFLDRGEDPLSH